MTLYHHSYHGMRGKAARALYLISLATILGGVIYLGLALERDLQASDPISALASPYEHHLLPWELEALAMKVAAKLTGQTSGGEDVVLERYFSLKRQADRSQMDGQQAKELARLGNQVEGILEGRIAALLKEVGLTISPPLFSGWKMVFPPVAVELEPPPKVLAVSPREAIRLERTILLAPKIGSKTRDDLEEAVDATGVSSLIVPLAGLGTYPTTVTWGGSYAQIVETAIHEWLHLYLALFPLGRNYFRSTEARTINETVADLAAKELAEAFLRRYPPPPSSPVGLSTPYPPILYQELRGLRRQVEELLSQGKIEDAEQLMEEKRKELAAKGFVFRKINQAFFAFYGIYAQSPASISPIGQKVEALRRKSPTLAYFLALVSRATTEKDLDAILATFP